MQLPEISSLQDYWKLDFKSAAFVETAHDILRSLKLPASSISHPTDGSSPVVLIDDNYVVKFFAPIFSDGFEMEKSALEFLSNIRSVSPRLLGAGAAGSWRYVVLDADEAQCFLHTEVMRDHVFFSTPGKDLSFSGFIDFEPSMIGAPEYDFAAVGIFLSSGSPPALRSFFLGYGNLESVDCKFVRRIMAYALLHKYSNLKWYLEFMPGADSLEELATKWWAV